ncbi:hypothetical protein HPB49_005043 [Dermacentor silvarum]|uniref:Uncharacterized protein n=1 Tax=Dermacentor silvarum TaxID=543639 RepID=A0ACB8CVV8_DERSI|nr:hypothetical protein HPB49_005043 [Dermacentor silvarum]
MNSVEVTLKSTSSSEEVVPEALEVDIISKERLPFLSISLQKKYEEDGFKLADGSCKGTSCIEIGILFGSDQYRQVMTGGIRRLEERLTAAETIFGWTVQGQARISASITEKSTVMVLNVNVDNCDIQTELSHFWDIENLGIKCPAKETRREEEVIQHFNRHLKFEEKRYSVRLPWRDNVELDENKIVAMNRLRQLTRRLQNDESIVRRYDSAIRDYLNSGVAEVVDEKSRPKTHCYYMPHQAVIKEDRQTTKIRIVFDASSSSTKGFFLNDYLET